MTDHRVVDERGSRIAFSCANRRFETDLGCGQRHRSSPTLGSVTGEPLVSDPEYSLWLEHVRDRHDEARGREEGLYWLIWYNDEQKPVIPLSAVFNRQQLANMARQLMQFLPGGG